jgi:hypothetical protein
MACRILFGRPRFVTPWSGRRIVSFPFSLQQIPTLRSDEVFPFLVVESCKTVHVHSAEYRSCGNARHLKLNRHLCMGNTSVLKAEG